jgi:biopolymer transport protein ExbD
MTRFLSLVLACLLIAGCVTKPSQNVIHLDSNGDMTLNGTSVTQEELASKLDRGVPVVVKISPRTSRGEVIKVMQIARQAGASTVSVSAEAWQKSAEEAAK